MSSIDHILIIGFGSPEKSEDVMEFLRIVTKGRNIPEQRLQAVAHHYDLIGGASPYNAEIFKFTKGLEQQIDLPIFVGMRNWHPFLKDTVKEISEKGLQNGIGIILAPHRSQNSCYLYKQNVQDAMEEAGVQGVSYEYLEPWYANEKYVGAYAKELQGLLEKEQLLPTETQILFTAHSIPESLLGRCSQCRYDEEFQQTAKIIADKLTLKKWTIGYQSRSGRPQDPWLGPDISEIVEQQKGVGVKNVVVVPVGFLCDNAEILYDLDIEVKEQAEKLGLRYFRVKTILNTPDIAGMFGEMIKQRIAHSV